MTKPTNEMSLRELTFRIREDLYFYQTTGKTFLKTRALNYYAAYKAKGGKKKLI
jgi:hypothetical protein